MPLCFGLKMPLSAAKKGIYHCNENGDVKVLFPKDATLVHEVYSGRMYAFFLINCQSGDDIKYISRDKLLHIPADDCFYKSSFRIESKKIGEIYKLLIEQNKPFPEYTEQLLKDNLKIFFDDENNLKVEEYSSVLQNYLCILEHLGKNASEFIAQTKIDEFMLKLDEKWALGQFNSIALSPAITISPEAKVAHEKAQKEFHDTITSVTEAIATMNYANLKCKSGLYRSYNFHLPETPCGDVLVNVFTEYSDLNVFIKIGNQPVINISDDFKEFQENFAQKYQKA